MFNSTSIADGRCVACVDLGLQIPLDLLVPALRASCREPSPSMRWRLGPAGFHLSRLRAPLADSHTQPVVWDAESMIDRANERRRASFIHRVCPCAQTAHDEPTVCVTAVPLHCLDYPPS